MSIYNLHLAVLSMLYMPFLECEHTKALLHDYIMLWLGISLSQIMHNNATVSDGLNWLVINYRSKFGNKHNPCSCKSKH